MIPKSLDTKKPIYTKVGKDLLHVEVSEQVIYSFDKETLVTERNALVKQSEDIKDKIADIDVLLAKYAEIVKV